MPPRRVGLSVVEGADRMPDARDGGGPLRRRAIGGFLLVAGAAFALMPATESRLAMVWDEGYTLGREARVRAWLALMIDPQRGDVAVDPPEFALVQADRPEAPPVVRPRPDQLRTRSQLLDSDVIAWYWPFAREEPHGHPPFYALVGLIGDVLAPSWEVLPRARLGPMLAFSVTAGAIFAVSRVRWGYSAGSAAAGFWVLHPHLFALGHYAHYDGLLSCLWVGVILAFSAAVEPGRARGFRWCCALGFGVLCGCAAGTKFTGWLLPIPLLAWTAVWGRNRRTVAVLALGAATAALTLYAFTPPFWAHPFEGVRRFLESNLTRGETIPIAVQFLGKVIKTPLRSLPWFNTLLWTAIATPIGLLLLGLVGVARAARLGLFGDRLQSARDPLATLALVNWGFLLVLRALPHVPGHDGVRLFLPAFGCLALLAGLGAARVVECIGRWGRLGIAVGLIEAAVSLAVMLPVPLSYYSPIVGGLPGATAIGMEPTYYWDALDADALRWLRAHTPADGAVRFSGYPRSLLYLHQVGRLGPTPIRAESPEPASWYVVQNRPGLHQAIDRELIASRRPAYRVVKLGVPLLMIYDDRELQAARAAIARRGDRERRSE